MGLVKSITHSYSYSEYLYWYIQKNDIANIENVLTKRPDLVNSRLTVNYKTTPLHRAAVNGNLDLCKLLIEKYKAQVDFLAENGETALIGAIKRNKIGVAKYLLQMGAYTDFVSGCGLLVIEYAILGGYYEIALMIYERMKTKQLKSQEKYEILSHQFLYRYVNFKIILQGLKTYTDPENIPDYLTKNKKIFEDPVVDPRETWKQWLKRNIEFKDPPIVERRDLPEQLQPQNRKFGKFRHFFTRLTISPLTQKPNFKPQNLTEAPSGDKINMKMQEQMSQMQVKSMG